MTCCFFSSFKTLLTSPRVIALGSELTSWTVVYLSLAGFQVIINGRFWVITEVTVVDGNCTLDHCGMRKNNRAAGRGQLANGRTAQKSVAHALED